MAASGDHDGDMASASTIEQTTPPACGAAPDLRKELVRQQVKQALFAQAGPAPRVGRFELLRKVGEGGMGTVYAAYDPRLKRELALKLLRQDGHLQGDAAQHRLMREAQALGRLAHPNVVTVFEVDIHQGSVVLAMELVRGPNLRQWLAQEPRQWQQITRVLLDAGEGVAAAHELGLIHRDIKPDNILVGIDGRPRISDFGLVRGPHDEQPAASAGSGPYQAPHASMTRSGALLGTPRYMAPEQLRGEPAGQLSDQFGFCATAFEALFGTPAFAGDNHQALLATITAGHITPIDPRHPARALLPLLQRGLHADPQQRFANMHMLLAALSKALGKPNAARRRWRWLAAAALPLVLLATAATGWALATSHSADKASSEKADQDKTAAHKASSGAAGFPADERAYQRAVQASQVGQHRECINATRAGPQTLRLLRVRIACADALNDKAEMKAACDHWQQNLPDDALPEQCDPLIEQAVALRKQGRPKACFELLETARWTARRSITLSRCASDINTREYYVRNCEYTSRQTGVACPPRIVEIGP